MHPDQLYIIIRAQQQTEQRQAEHSRLIREIQRNAMGPSALQILGRLGSVLRGHWALRCFQRVTQREVM
jgi:hypothetical protein